MVRTKSSNVSVWSCGDGRYRLNTFVPSTTGRLLTAYSLLRSQGFSVRSFTATPLDPVVTNDPGVGGILCFELGGPSDADERLVELGNVMQTLRLDPQTSPPWAAKATFGFSLTGKGARFLELILDELSVDGVSIIAANHEHPHAECETVRLSPVFESQFEVTCRSEHLAMHVWASVEEICLKWSMPPARPMFTIQWRPAFRDSSGNTSVLMSRAEFAEQLRASANV